MRMKNQIKYSSIVIEGWEYYCEYEICLKNNILFKIYCIFTMG